MNEPTAEITTPVISHERRSVVSKPLEPQELLTVTDAINRVWGEDSRYTERLKKETQQAEILVNALLNGALSTEQAAKIIASRNTELAMETETDALTDLPNRPGIENILREQVLRAKVTGNPISVAFVDLDKFKDINDRYSHDAGDAVLQGVGGYLKSELKRTTDNAGRWGGEEFIVVLADTKEEGARKLLEDLKTNMNENVSEAALNSGGHSFDRPITASMGLVTSIISPNDSRPIEEICFELISIADKRVHLAKENGRNRVVASEEEKDLEGIING